MRFVILDHQPPEQDEPTTARTLDRHYDLMFEIEGQENLATVACFEISLCAGEDAEITRLKDHDPKYLSYEGPVSDNRGVVLRYASGSWDGELFDNAVLAFDEESNNFAGQTWTIRIEQDRLLRIA